LSYIERGGEMKEESEGQGEVTAGWYETLQEAADAALADESIEFDQIQKITFDGRKKNPLHEYKANLRHTD
jgi:hypothetical protein